MGVSEDAVRQEREPPGLPVERVDDTEGDGRHQEADGEPEAGEGNPAAPSAERS